MLYLISHSKLTRLESKILFSCHWNKPSVEISDTFTAYSQIWFYILMLRLNVISSQYFGGKGLIDGMDKEQAIKGLTITYPDVSHNSTQCTFTLRSLHVFFFKSCVLWLWLPSAQGSMDRWSGGERVPGRHKRSHSNQRHLQRDDGRPDVQHPCPPTGKIPQRWLFILVHCSCVGRRVS